MAGWNTLGTITPSTTWLTYPSFAPMPQTVFKATYYGGFEDNASNVYLRAYYRIEGNIFRDANWKLLIPKIETEIFTYPTIPEYINTVTSRGFEIKKVFKYKYRDWGVPQPEYSVKLDVSRQESRFLDISSLNTTVADYVNLIVDDIIANRQ